MPKNDFLQEFCTINKELKGNESVSRGDNWFTIPQREFLLEPKDTFEVKRYHNDFHSYFSIYTSKSWVQKLFKLRDKNEREENIEMSQKEHHVGDKCVNIVQIANILYMYP